jgi:diguanylate cyclase (GGDEF)-like protein
MPRSAAPLSPPPGRLLSGRIASGALVGSAVLGAVELLPHPAVLRPAVVAAGCAGALGAMVVGIQRNAPPRRGPFEVLLLGAAGLASGGLLQLVDHTAGVFGPRRPVGGDVVVLIGSVLMAFAFTVLARAPYPHNRVNLDTVLDGTVAAVCVYAILWLTVVGPASAGHPASVFRRVVLALPCVLMVYACTVALSGIWARAPRSPAARALTAAAAAVAVAEGLDLVVQLRRTTVPGAVLGAFDLLSAGCLAAAFLHPTVRRLFGGRLPGGARPQAGAELVAVVVAPAALAVAGLVASPQSGGAASVLVAGAATSAVVAAWRVERAARTAVLREARLAHQVTHDPLTGLGNRTAAEQAITAALGAAARAGEQVAVVFLDLDRFKLVNEAHGYSVGDGLLVEVGARLTRTFGRRGVVARVGGDEFVVVVFPVLGPLAAGREAELAHRALAAPFALYGTELAISVSVGVAVGSATEAGADAESLLRDADTAMYQAKESGRDMVVRFDSSMRDRIADRLALEHDLRQAVERDELRLAFQPIVTLGEGPPTVAGLEALLRWERPTRGLVPASAFIECAEAAGLLTEIGDWVIREAATRLAGWREVPGAEGLFVAVNVSALHLKSHTLLARIRRVLAETGLAPDVLCLELAEPTLMERPAEGVALVLGLRELGVRIAVDDFGHGYGSLAYLRQFPVDYVKIDRRLIEPLVDPDAAEATLVAAIVAMARSVNAVTVAEGVEHERQEQVLRELGCDLAQGFLYARPVHGDEVVPTLRAISPRQGLRLVTGDGGARRPGR